ncbi:pyruvate dehydrogenase (acetyl-transferring) E1 component subunit alpha [Halobacteriales archaeon QS_8_69_26]|nr:MAG: pyruvate dehydrogenase (acetyl-transferring) E1 component subunit alpha [Halobacteriales archaeon QS_8_69_26]
MSTIRQGDPGRVEVLDEEGAPRDGAVLPDLDDGDLVAMYRDMYFLRRFDRRMVGLSRQGRIGSLPPLRGHEAVQAATVHALDDGDWIVPSYREHGAMTVHGLDPARVLWYFMGREDGNAVPSDVNALPINGSVGSQVPHATGAAWAARMKGDDRAFACYFGDGATSEGDFHEGMNFAGVFDAPVVFVCSNNQWAISVPRERQTAAATLAQKARAYGFEGLQVDGTDPLALYRVTRDAVRKAKDPDEDEARPTMVEAVLYRLGAHSTADDPDVYRDGVPEEWERKDPVPRFESFLLETGRLDGEDRDALQDEVEGRIDDAVDRAEAAAAGDPDEIFEHTYADLPPRLREQRDYLDDLRERRGDDALLNDDH